jgi:uncharacterized protein YaiL (DUF2058 family)
VESLGGTVSLRDQLLAKGVVSKKDAKRVDRELKQERRAEQGARNSKAELEAEERARREAEEQARFEARRRERLEIEARKEAAEKELRVRNLLTANQLRPGHGQPFWHSELGGSRLLRMDVSSGTAYQLRCGEAAIAAHQRPGWLEYVVISRKAASKLLEIAPERLVFFVQDTSGISEPDLAFLARRWDTSLLPHRATERDLERFRARSA